MSVERKTVAIVSTKGGVGRTTSVIYLASAIFDLFREPALIVDASPHLDAISWVEDTGLNLGEPPKMRAAVATDPLELYNTINAASGWVIIDTGSDEGAIQSACAHADAVIIPTRNSTLDLSHVPETLRIAASVCFGPVRVLHTLCAGSEDAASFLREMELLGVEVCRVAIPALGSIALGADGHLSQLGRLPYLFVAHELVQALDDDADSSHDDDGAVAPLRNDEFDIDGYRLPLKDRGKGSR